MTTSTKHPIKTTDAINTNSTNPRVMTKVLFTCGVVGPLAFIVTFLIEGATRPGYSAWRDYVSDLSLSNQGWMQVANFLVCGTLTLAFAIGLRQAWHTGKGAVWGPLLLGVFGLGLIVAGLNTTDPQLGYPPGADFTAPQTLHGTIHGIAGLCCFLSVGIAAFVMARRFAADPAWKGWAVYSRLTGSTIIVFFILSTVASVLDEKGIMPDAPTGILQRVAIIVGWGWVALLAFRLLRQPQSAQQDN